MYTERFIVNSIIEQKAEDEETEGSGSSNNKNTKPSSLEKTDSGK